MKKIVSLLLVSAVCSALFAGSVKKSVVQTAASLSNGISVQWAESGTVALKLYSANGKVIKSIPRLAINAGQSTTIDISGIASGVYYLTVNTGRDIQTIPLAK